MPDAQRQSYRREPKENRNAWKHGAKARRVLMRLLLKADAHSRPTTRVSLQSQKKQLLRERWRGRAGKMLLARRVSHRDYEAH
jgi:beta-lactamase class A